MNCRERWAISPPVQLWLQQDNTSQRGVTQVHFWIQGQANHERRLWTGRHSIGKMQKNGVLMRIDDLALELTRQIQILEANGGLDGRHVEADDTRDVDLVHEPVVLLGAGSIQAQPFVAYALKHFKVVAAVDNPRRGQRLGNRTFSGDEDLPEIFRQYPHAVGVMCGCTDGAVNHFLKSWAVFGRPLLSIFQAMRRSDMRIPVPQRSAQTIAQLRSYAEETSLFRDETSQRTFLSLLLHYMSWDRRWLDDIRLPLKNMYFFTDALQVGEDEILLDGGAFDGDTIMAFSRLTGGRYGHIHAFEADPHNLTRLRASIGHNERVTVHPVGLWDKECTLRFSSGSDAGAIGDDGELEIACKSLDKMDLGRISFLKLDIEGAEIPALSGAAQTIAHYKPKLAIAAYHKADDLITIPKLIREIRGDYVFSLRHHSVYHNDSVLYAS